MNKDEYGEIINGKGTYSKIAEKLYFDNWEYPSFSSSVLIGWTDEECDYRDILFTYRPQKPCRGNYQRGMDWCNLFVGIIDFTTYGFVLESDRDNTKYIDYLREKLQLGDNSCDDKICELVNGVIHELDILEGNIKIKVNNDSNV